MYSKHHKAAESLGRRFVQDHDHYDALWLLKRDDITDQERDDAAYVAGQAAIMGTVSENLYWRFRAAISKRG